MARLTLPPIKFFCVSKPKHDKNSFDLKKHLMWWEPGFGWGKRSESIFIIPVTVGANRKLYISSFDHAADIFYFHLASAFTPKRQGHSIHVAPSSLGNFRAVPFRQHLLMYERAIIKISDQSLFNLHKTIIEYIFIIRIQDV